MLLHRGAGRQLVGFGIALLLGCGSPMAASDPEGMSASQAAQTTVVERGQAGASERAEQEQSVLAIVGDRGDPARRLDEDELDQVLSYHCGECHLGPSERCGMSYIDDLDKLIATGKVIPGDGAGSRLVQRMLRAEMPPILSEAPAVPEATVDLIVDFIDHLDPGALPGQ